MLLASSQLTGKQCHRCCLGRLSSVKKFLYTQRNHAKSLLSSSPVRLYGISSINYKDDQIDRSKFNSVKESAHEAWSAHEEWTQVKKEPFHKRLGLYSKLSKSRLTLLVTLTASAGYYIAPGEFNSIIFLCTSLGTYLCSSSANSLNQIFETPYDSQMVRTKDRVLVRGKLRPLEAVYFGALCGLSGVALLASMVNWPAAILGLLNIVLYAGVYTPSKRMHIANTWIGAVVGAIPPVIGWVGCTGTFDLNALILAGLLYSWQFPHFNALSWNYRQDYSRAGYQMMSVTDTALCRRVTLRHAIAQIPLCFLASYLHVASWSFFVMSLIPNGYILLCSWSFYRNSNNSTARALFLGTLWQLPLVLVLLCVLGDKGDELPEIG